MTRRSHWIRRRPTRDPGGGRKKALDDLKKSYRELESESKVNREMIVKSNEKLRAVKTNKEYQSILKEIEEIRKKNSGIEDQMLDQLEAIRICRAGGDGKRGATGRVHSIMPGKKETLMPRKQGERQAVEALNDKRRRSAPRPIRK
jgi:predicted  nucleic acid-binding Zn-ribbon protein